MNLHIPSAGKISPKLLYLAPFQDKYVYAFYAEFQDGRQIWREKVPGDYEFTL